MRSSFTHKIDENRQLNHVTESKLNFKSFFNLKLKLIFSLLNWPLVLAPVLEAVDGGAPKIGLGILCHVQRRLGPLLLLDGEPILAEGLNRRQL